MSLSVQSLLVCACCAALRKLQQPQQQQQQLLQLHQQQQQLQQLKRQQQLEQQQSMTTQTPFQFDCQQHKTSSPAVGAPCSAGLAGGEVAGGKAKGQVWQKRAQPVSTAAALAAGYGVQQPLIKQAKFPPPAQYSQSQVGCRQFCENFGSVSVVRICEKTEKGCCQFY